VGPAKDPGSKQDTINNLHEDTRLQQSQRQIRRSNYPLISLAPATNSIS